MAIGNDSEFKAALGALPVARQRQAAARLVESVMDLCDDARVKGAVAAARRPDISEIELAALFQAAKTANVESFTQCGQECDWRSQAGHFVAEAAMACTLPTAQARNLAWDAAMNARMARTCAGIATGEGTENREAEQQYRILDQFLAQ